MKAALVHINKRVMMIIGKLLELRQCQKQIQGRIITTSISEFGYGLPASPIIDHSMTLQSLFLREAHCEYNIRGRLMKWKIQMATVKQMIEHEILFQQEGFASPFDCKLFS